MIADNVKKGLTTIARVVDYPISLIGILACLVGFPFTIPWILKQRRIWEHSAKGSPKALLLRGFTLQKLQDRGYEHLIPFRNPSLDWLGFLDPVNSRKTEIKIADDLYVITWPAPLFVRLMEKAGLVATAIIFRELIASFQIAGYCVHHKIGLLRAYKHNYPALRACLVSHFIKIPYIVDISGNYELVRRLTGKAFYLKLLHKIPILNIFARSGANWLLGWPLRSAFRVLGRNKNNYEHAFALGTPVEKLSLLRINNFNEAFNAYNPAQPPPRQVDYPYILFVGRLAKINYPLDAIDAFNMAAPQLPEYRLVIIGDGPMRKKVEQRIASSAHKDRILMLGRCSNDVVLNCTAHAMVAVCPYSGATLVEAMLCGIPVIAYDVEWHSEIVIDDYTGFLVPFPSIPALAEKLVHVVRNYDEARRTAQNGRDLARVAFDQEKIMKKESMYYKQALTSYRG